MIFPGHIAASVLCHRYLRVDLQVALVAGIIPDVVDKGVYYGFHLGPNSRVPMHTLCTWWASTLLIFLIGYAFRRNAARSWATAWFVSYGAHLVCDSPLIGGRLPFLWPFWSYTFDSPNQPLGFLLGLDEWPIRTLIAEALLVGLTLYLERGRIAGWLAAPRAAWPGHGERLMVILALWPSYEQGHRPVRRRCPFSSINPFRRQFLPSQRRTVPGAEDPSESTADAASGSIVTVSLQIGQCQSLSDMGVSRCP